MKSYFGSYSTSPGAEPIDSTVLVFDKNLNIGFRNPDGSNAMVNWLLKEVEASFDFSSQQTRLRHTKATGAELLIKGNDAASFIREMQTEQQKAWHKKSSGKEWIRNSVLLLGTLGLLFLLYLLIVPWLSQKLASKVSIKTEKQLGDAVYDALGLAAQEDSAKTVAVNRFFTAMDVPTGYAINITVVNNKVVNAFALPGGRIVVYSALLKEITSYPELAALLSHEFIHINNKHSTKRIFRQLGSKVFLGLLFGRFGTVTNVLVNHADNLKSLKYSRNLEKEADMDGLAILQKREIDPNGFINLFHHLEESARANATPEFLGSHPDVSRRIAYIKEAASGTVVTEDAELKAIFEQLK
ncbi:MAG: M48 family metallopeptidase [Bacteroidota bacterium]|mgnify:CR=1 FL=1|nr:M48 family metallopeptidase [Bacteroidota bacterium]